MKISQPFPSWNLLKNDNNLGIKQYDPFIDFLKGISILFVVFLHVMPAPEKYYIQYWASMAVPMFFLIHTFHVFRKDNYHFDLYKLCKRIVLPFILIQIFLYINRLCQNPNKAIETTRLIISQGGFGYGSYFPWVFIQFAACTAFVKFLLDKFKENICFAILVCVIVIISIFQEFLFESFSISEYAWRLFVGRYLFLICLGYILIKKETKKHYLSLFWSFISLAFIFLFSQGFHLYPFFIKSNWIYHRWICFPYVAFFLLRVLFKCHLHCGNWINSILKRIGRASYEVFLLQLFLLDIDLFAYMPIDNVIITHYLKILGTIFLSIILGIIWNNYISSFKIKNSYEKKVANNN